MGASSSKAGRFLRTMVWAVLLLGSGWLALGYAFQRSLLFPRGMLPAASSTPELATGAEIAWLETEQGEVETWFFRGHGASADAPGPAVVFAHGNAELIDHQDVIVAGYVQRGLSVLLVEYRGYGRSAGSPSQERIVADFSMAYAALVERPEVDRERIVFHGRSIGTGVVCALSLRHRPAAFVLRSPFLSVKSFLPRFGQPSFLARDPFDNLAALRAYDGPVLILHGTRDEVIPVTHGRRLAQEVEGATLVEVDAGHNDFPEHGAAQWRAIDELLDRVRG